MIRKGRTEYELSGGEVSKNDSDQTRMEEEEQVPPWRATVGPASHQTLSTHWPLHFYKGGEVTDSMEL